MSDFTFYWNAPSSIWVRCGICRELIEVNYGDTPEDVQRRADEHEHTMSEDDER